MVSPRPLVPILVGPTASGKSAAAMAMAARRPVEIISVDSALVYRGMDIGTAKPGAADRAAVVHHLIDIVSPHEPYSAARFVHDARTCIEQVRARGRLPLLVGGTMLYAKALVDGLHAMAPADARLREELDEQARAQGWPALHARLAQLDPATAARLEPTDSQRIQRALEVCLLSGEPMSALFARTLREPVDENFILIALEPSDRAVLHARIAQRFRAMLDAGFVDEVRVLRADPRLHAGLPAMRAVGYRQVWAWLDMGANGATAELLQARCVAATRQLAKRQLTWLRKLPVAVRIDCLAPDAAPQVIAAVERLLDN